ncbi:hypothetical protein [Acanthopleuribacter pedis]|uniref:Restriction endonuclease n=1 Tax=Acanthopleuribacter pedis TaxID=442870 RepID=A0A8J7Q5L8_9BACT|nr:hypothetical protein [Acanthopleuribacter pedis]MBO1318406.1 hypothetical protein [Acanthopleuribacter pedis]
MTESVTSVLWRAWLACAEWLAADPLRPLFVAAVLMLAVFFATRFFTARWRRWTGFWLNRRGSRAERAALRLLKKAGYDLVDDEPRLVYHLLIDGERQAFSITPDYVVRRDGCDYIVEVKRKDKAGTIRNGQVRRQVVEYALASQQPCLLVDMNAREITEVALARH